MFYKQIPVKITGYGLAAGCQIFYRKLYVFFIVCLLICKRILEDTEFAHLSQSKGF